MGDSDNSEGNKNQQQASQEGQKAGKNENTTKIVAALDRITRELHAEDDRASPSQKGKRYREWFTITGLYLAAGAAVAAIVVTHSDLASQLITQQTSLEKQISLLDLSTRPILASSFTAWQAKPAFKAGIAPIISFPIKNVGHSNAQILSATYESTISSQIPVRFGEVQDIQNFPGLLPPEVTAPIVISDLPTISASDFQAISSGNASMWLRTIFIFRDDSGVVYEIRFTGAYSNRPDADGGHSYGFAFPDREVPKRLWRDYNFGGLRCLNAVASEHHDFGCGAPQ